MDYVREIEIDLGEEKKILRAGDMVGFFIGRGKFWGNVLKINKNDKTVLVAYWKKNGDGMKERTVRFDRLDFDIAGDMPF